MIRSPAVQARGAITCLTSATSTIMSIEIQSNEQGLVIIRISGILQQPELVAGQSSLAEQLAGGEKVALLVDARDFEGWGKGGDWGDLDAQYRMDPLIRKMALVVDPQWETLATAFIGKGLRRFPVELFAPSDFPEALAWASSP